MEIVTEFVIDLSGSMRDKIGLTKRMLLSDVIPFCLGYSSRIGIKSFSAVPGEEAVVQELPLSVTDEDAITAAVKKLAVKPKGRTPISEAIRQSVATLKECSSSSKEIILVTDGEEDREGDYVAECKKAQTEGINCKIHIIGIKLNNRAQLKAQEITQLTKGTYSNVTFNDSTPYNQSIIKRSLSPFYSVIPKSVSKLQPVNNSKDIVQPQAKVVRTSTEIAKEQCSTAISVNRKTEKQEVPEIIEDDELNENIRLISEKYLYEYLKTKYPNRIRWLNENGESSSDHDFEILGEDGIVKYYVECKGTAKQKSTFYVTKSEWQLFLNNTGNYQIYFIQNVFTSPSHVFISNVLDWLLKGKLLPYLKTRDIVKEERVFLTISDSEFI